MAFRVEIPESALADAEDFVTYVRRDKHDPAGAERWWNGLLDVLLSLEQRPGRGSLVVEAALRCDRFSINRTGSYLTWTNRAR